MDKRFTKTVRLKSLIVFIGFLICFIIHFLSIKQVLNRNIISFLSWAVMWPVFVFSIIVAVMILVETISRKTNGKYIDIILVTAIILFSAYLFILFLKIW